MKKILTLIMFAFAMTTACMGQKLTINGEWTTIDDQSQRFKLASIEIDRPNNKTYVTIEVETTKSIKGLKPTVNRPVIIGEHWRSYESDFAGFITDSGLSSLDNNIMHDVIWINVNPGTIHWYKLVFNVAIPYTETAIKVIVSESSRFNEFHPLWFNCNIDEITVKTRPFDLKNLGVHDLAKVRKYIEKNIASLDPIEGIYRVSLKRASKSIDWGIINHSYSYQCVIIREGDCFFVKKTTNVDEGEVYNAQIFPIGESNIYDIKMEYSSGYINDHTRKTASSRLEMNSMFRFQFKSQMIYYPLGLPHYSYDDEFDFIKEYPTPTMYEAIQTKIEEETHPQAWTGTGYAIGNGFIVTNNHVVDRAKSISIKGVKGDINNKYTAEVMATDKVNDLAIIRINDPNFNGFGTIPYAVQQRMADVGEDVFVLGYPLTQALGNEIKLTNGIISSRTGYQGNISTYQMSAPVQPGNSGGPMFDMKGRLVGVVCARHTGAENASYAIKTSYLKNLIESVSSAAILSASDIYRPLSTSCRPTF